MTVLDSLLATGPATSGDASSDMASWQASRDAHRAIVQQQGLPDRRVENWKYTALRALEGRNFQRLGEQTVALQPEDLAAALKDKHLPQLAPVRLVFVSGRFAPKLSHGSEDAGVSVSTLSQLSEAALKDLAVHLDQRYEGRDEGFAALNTALATDGAVIAISAAANSQTPLVVELLCVDISSGEAHAHAQALRHVITVNDGAELTLIERHLVLDDCSTAAASGNLINSLSQISLAENASLHHVRLPTLAANTVMVSRTDVTVAAGGQYSCTGLDVSGELVRHDLNVVMTGEGGHADLAGVYAPVGNTHIDIHCKIDHSQPNATSNQNFRGVMADHSRAVFNGKVVVREGADGTDASQSNANLLLSPNAEIDTKPELEIYADDVKCAHGTTVGALSEDQLFYLTARGIERDLARRMLTTAFCRQVLETIASESLRDQALAQLEHHLQETSS